MANGRLRLGAWVLGGVAVVGLLGWVILHRPPAPEAGRARAGMVPSVVAAPVTKGELPVTVRALGTVTPLSRITVRPQLSGQLVEVGFQEGQTVKQGDFLAQIDPRPYELSLSQYQGQLQRDQALLKNAKLDLERYRVLVQQDSIARQQLTAQEALVQQYEGTVASDTAQINTAKLNLTYARITAPVSGRVGLRVVDPGNYVTTGDANGIVTITQMQPMSIVFTLPEDQLPAVRAQLRQGATLAVTAYDRAGKTKLAEGRLTTLDNAIDTSTGTVKLRASFDNGDEALFPNQFVNVEMRVETRADATLIPSAALLQGAKGPFVYVLDAENKVSVRPVTPGPAFGQQVAINAGLEPGEKVVTDGTDKLRDGMVAKVAGDRAAAADGTPGQHAGQHQGAGK